MLAASGASKPQLIAYADRLGGDISGVAELLGTTFAGAFGGVHILPFFVPIDGADAGFDPTDHTTVDPRLGTWRDITELADNFTVMSDVIVNHISTESSEFQAWVADADGAPTTGMFLTPERVFGGTPTPEQLAAIYRPRPTPPFTEVGFADGSRRLVWTTFTSQQADIDVEHPLGWRYLTGILDQLHTAGVTMIRLDAVGYAIKRAGTSCFMIPETFEFVERLTAACHERDMLVLVEIHGHHLDQIEIARQVDLVYDFALPPLVLDAFYAGDATPLEHWIRIRPHNSINVLDTHDGIGVIDVGHDPRRPERPRLLSPERLHALVEGIHEHSGGASRLATGATASNLDLYQVNCTFYDAFGRDDRRYLAARLIQLLLPGTPQVYYVGLLAGTNDVELLGQTGVGRDINRHHYTRDEIDRAVEQPVVRALLDLLRWRSTESAFEGVFELLNSADHLLSTRWTATSGTTLDVTIDLTSGLIDTNDPALRTIVSI